MLGAILKNQTRNYDQQERQNNLQPCAQSRGGQTIVSDCRSSERLAQHGLEAQQTLGAHSHTPPEKTAALPNTADHNKRPTTKANATPDKVRKEHARREKEASRRKVQEKASGEAAPTAMTDKAKATMGSPPIGTANSPPCQPFRSPRGKGGPLDWWAQPSILGAMLQLAGDLGPQGHYLYPDRAPFGPWPNATVVP